MPETLVGEYIETQSPAENAKVTLESYALDSMGLILSPSALRGRKVSRAKQK